MVLWHIFYTNRSTEGSSADYVLYSFCRSMRLLFIPAVKILLQSFCMKIWARWPYIHLSVVFPSRMPTRTALCYATNTISENIPNIWHKSSTKHKEVRPIETIKTIMQTTRPRITWKVHQQTGCHFKEIFDQVRKKFRLWIVLFWTKTSQRLTLYLLSRPQIIFTSCWKR